MRNAAARIAAFDDLVFSTELGRVVRERRKALGLPQTAVAERSNGAFTQNWLSKVETGEHLTAPPDKLLALAHSLEMPFEDLQKAQDRVVQLADEQMAKGWAVGKNPAQELVTLLHKLNKPDQRTLVRLARAMLYGQRLLERYGDDAEPRDVIVEAHDGAGIEEERR